MNLVTIGKKLFGAKVLINIIKKENGGHHGRDAGRWLDGVLDRQISNKKSYQVEKYIIPFVEDFCEAFCEELRKGCGE